MLPQQNQLRDLLALLTASVETIECLSAKASVPIPSLDDPQPQPSDAIAKSGEWLRAIWAIQAATQQMNRLVSDPNEAVLLVRVSPRWKAQKS